MPAFTYLGRRVNISLAYNTITIYDHSPAGWLNLPMDIFNINGSKTIVIDELTQGHMEYNVKCLFPNFQKYFLPSLI